MTSASMQTPESAPHGSTYDSGSDARTLRFRFTGDTSEYFKIWIVNIALTIATLGIYSAWAKVRNKTYFYRATEVAGTSFDYRADPKKILKGRILIAVLLGALALAQQVHIGIYIVLALAYLLVVPALLTLSLRFNARYSSYRNIPFSFSGSIGQTYGELIAAGLIQTFSLGMALPLARYRVRKFVLNNHLFGLERFNYSGTAGDFFRVYLKVMLLVFVLVAFGSGTIAAMMSSMGKESGAMAAVGLVGVLYIAIIPLLGFLNGALARAVWSKTQVGAHQLECSQTGRQMAWLYLSNALAILVSLGLLTPWAKIRLARYRAESMTLHASGSLDTELFEMAEQASALGDAAMDLGDFDFDFGF